MSELAFWASYGINPFERANELYASRPGADRPKREPKRRIVKTKPRKPRGQRRAVGKGPKMQSRSTFPPKGSRPFSRKTQGVING